MRKNLTKIKILFIMQLFKDDFQKYVYVALCEDGLS